MNPDWQTISIQDIAENSSSAIAIGPFGSRMKSDCYVESGVPVVRGSNITGGKYPDGDFVYVTEEKAYELKTSEVIAGDLVFPHRGAIGRVALIPEGERMILSSSLMKLSPDKNKCSPSFLLYFFRSKIGIHELLKNASTVGTPGIGQPLTSLKQITLDLPPVKVQESIAHILGTLDDKIQLNRKTNETLEGIAKAIFKSWFVDFDPVRAKAEGRPTGLPDEISDLFPDSFEESAVGEIPSGWRAASIYEISKVVYGAPFSSKLFNTVGKGMPLARIRDLKTGSPGVYTEETHPKGCLIEPGDSVVGMDGEFRPYLWSSEKCWMNQRVCKFVPSRRESNYFVRQSIARPLMEVELSETATTVIHLGKSDIDRFQIVLPSEEVLEAFDSVASPIEESVVSGNQQNTILYSLRDALLPRLISGDLRVPDAEKMLEEACI